MDSLGASAKRRYAVRDKFNIENPIFKKLVQTMAQQGTILDATLALYQMDIFDESIFLQGIELTKLAYKHGVKIGVGTDISMDRFRDHFSDGTPLTSEMKVLVDLVGMTPLEVLKSTTFVNAEMIGMENEIGSLSPGKRADILVLYKNPLDDIENIRSIKNVFKRGKVFHF